MTILVEIVRSADDGENRRVIAECNMYDGDVLIRQCSRSPLSFPSGTTDESIIERLQTVEYAAYFAPEPDEL